MAEELCTSSSVMSWRKDRDWHSLSSHDLRLSDLWLLVENFLAADKRAHGWNAEYGGECVFDLTSVLLCHGDLINVNDMNLSRSSKSGKRYIPNQTTTVISNVI